MKPVYTHFEHWLPRFLKQGAITLGHHVYFTSTKRDVSLSLIKHELIHVGQIEKVGVIRFYAQYLLEYAGYRRMGGHDAAYRSISFEKEAYDNQAIVLTCSELQALYAGGYRHVVR